VLVSASPVSDDPPSDPRAVPDSVVRSESTHGSSVVAPSLPALECCGGTPALDDPGAPSEPVTVTVRPRIVSSDVAPSGAIDDGDDQRGSDEPARITEPAFPEQTPVAHDDAT